MFLVKTRDVEVSGKLMPYRKPPTQYLSIKEFDTKIRSFVKLFPVCLSCHFWKISQFVNHCLSLIETELRTVSVVSSLLVSIFRYFKKFSNVEVYGKSDSFLNNNVTYVFHMRCSSDCTAGRAHNTEGDATLSFPKNKDNLNF